MNKLICLLTLGCMTALSARVAAQEPPTGNEAGHPVKLATLSPGTAFRECGDCPEMVRVPAGSFRMGVEIARGDRRLPLWERVERYAPVHPVVINYPLAVSRYPVTRGQWRRYLASTHRAGSVNCRGLYLSGKTVIDIEQRPEYSWQNPGFMQEDSHPLVCVTWMEAQDYAMWLTAKTGRNYRLLSEAEYEYVARAGGASTYPWGEESRLACRYANVVDDAAFKALEARRPVMRREWCDDGSVFTSPVGHFQANNFGLYDTTGNVASWVYDCWNETHAGAAADGSARKSGDCARHVVRGSSFVDDPFHEISGADRGSSDDSQFTIGLRLARGRD